MFFFSILDSDQLNNLLPFKPIKKLIYICTYIQVNPSPWALQFNFFFLLCLRVCLQFHFYYSCDIFTKVRYQYFMYLWFVCCWRQTTGVWHTGSCKLSIASAVMLFYLFRFANKGSVFHFGSVVSPCSVQRSVIPTRGHEGAETPQRQELRKPEQNTIFIHYIHYIQCNTTRLSTHSLYPQSSAHWSESTSLKTPESHPGV